MKLIAPALICLLLFETISISSAQVDEPIQNLDSLYQLTESESDSIKALALQNLFEHYHDFNPDSTEYFYKQLQALSETSNSLFVDIKAGLNAGARHQPS